MTPIDQIGWNHRAALWWLGLLYRRPRQFREALEALPRWRRIAAGLVIMLHSLPWTILISIAASVSIRAVLNAPISFADQAADTAKGVALGVAIGTFLSAFGGTVSGIAGGIAFGIAGELAFGVAYGVTRGLSRGIDVGIINGIVFGAPFGIVVGIARASSTGLANWIFGGFAYGIAGGIAYALAGGLAFGTTHGIVGGAVLGVAITMCVMRAYYLPPHLLFVWPVVQGRWYRRHPVAWDDRCSLPFPGLDRLLLGYAAVEPGAALQEIERLVDSYPSQRYQALKARAVLIARETAAEPSLARLDAITARLPRGDTGFLTRVPDLHDRVAAIAAEQRRLDTLTRPAFREPIAALVLEKIKTFHAQIAGFPQPLAAEFRAAAQAWQDIAERQWRNARQVMDREPTPQLFRAGDPVDRNQEAFVLRGRVVGALEGQIMLATGCPGLVLYGRRRTGKSTLLRNLDGFLPPEVTVTALSMQNPRAFTSLADFAGLLAARIAAALPEAPRPDPAPADLRALFAVLEGVDHWLADQGRRLILAIDEYEFIDDKIGERVFPSDLLSTFRESIQSHRRLIWLFAGSNPVDELTAAPWTSNLVSLRTVDMPLFDFAETRLLLTEPARHSRLWDKDDARRPRFAPEFWGDAGIEAIHAEAGGWPHLVQLLAETAVNLVNDTGSRAVTPDLYQRTLAEAIVSGDLVLRQLLERECRTAAEWAWLQGFRTADALPPPADDAAFTSLRRRLLIVPEGDHWRLRVPLMGRWLRERG